MTTDAPVEVHCPAQICCGCNEYSGLVVNLHQPDHGEFSPCYCGCSIYDGDDCYAVLNPDGSCPNAAGHDRNFTT